MSTALIRRDEPQSLSLPEIMSLGDVFTKSGYFRDVREQAQAVVKILYGSELGFSPVISMMGVHVIEGKPALSANLMGAMVKRSGKYNYRVTTLTDKAFTLEFFEGGKSAGESSFTIEDAQRAGVVRPGGGWVRYPRNMLFARALSNGVKLFCPDLSACPIYVPEEMGAEVNEEGEVVEMPKSAKPVETTKEPVRFTRKDNKAEDDALGVTLGMYSAAPNGGQGGTTSKGSPDATETPSTAGDAQQPVMLESAPPSPDSPAVEFIGVNQQKNFHQECRKAVSERRKMDADNLTYQWLMDNKYVDEAGQPTAAKIPATGWLEVRRMACAWLKVQ